VLGAPQWLAREDAHRRRARELTRPHRERRERGERHAVEDFLFDYYALRAGRLERWHPGAGVRLAPAAAEGTAEDAAERLGERADWRWYRWEGTGVEVDGASLL